MTVFAVFADEFEGYHLVGIFSTREKADRVAAEAKKIFHYSLVKEMEVDAGEDKKAVPRWSQAIDIMTGELGKPSLKSWDYDCKEEFVWNDDDTMSPDEFSPWLVDLPYSNTGYLPNKLFVFSKKGAEAAKELALKSREELLKKIDITKVQICPDGMYYPLELMPKPVVEDDKL